MKILTFSAAPAVRLLGEGATACRAALPACLAMQKKTARERPFPYFFATPIKQAEPLYTLSN
ncbi:MAG TPA: hypothetical protein EYH06_06130 [Chromatiales bacterium]|nr:hypothetical protein [Chromatiales bacterium]